jgi:hypothetical protein
MVSLSVRSRDWKDYAARMAWYAFVVAGDIDYSSDHGYQSGIHFTSDFIAGHTYIMFAQPMTRYTVRTGIVEGEPTGE